MATLAEVTAMTNTIPPSTEENVTRRALHIRLKFNKLGNSRKVKTSQIDVGDADEELIRVSKKLLDSPELKAIGSADSEIKSFITKLCLPFPDNGVRLVPFGAVERVTKKLREYASYRGLLVDSFMAVYDAEKDRAQTRLKHLYNAKDYPPAEAVRAEFGFSYEFTNFGPPADLKEIDPDIFAQERDKAAKTMQNAVEMGQAMLLQTLIEMVTRLKSNLEPDKDGKKPKLYKTAVTNLQEFIENFNLRNVSNYRELEAQVERARRIVGDVNTDQIKESDTLRTALTKEMGEIEKTLQGMITTKTRKFKFDVGVQ